MSVKTETAAKDAALGYCADFISEFDRAASIMEMMEDGISAVIGVAIGRNELVDPHVVNQYTLNVYWLRRMLHQSCEDARKHLEAAGQHTDPRS